MSWYGGFAPYVSVAERRAKAAKHVAKLVKKGRVVSPVEIQGRTIARTFWGKAWCENLEAYSDLSNRLPRGQRYVRNGSVVDLQIAPGKVTALVSGSEIYEIAIDIKALAAKTWESIKKQCAGQIGTAIELLKGKLSEQVMKVITHKDNGLFPSPKEIQLDCSCPDGAYMCKHIAAVLYGVGARLDTQPEIFFTLRKVDHMELISLASDVQAITQSSDFTAKTLADDQVADVFGIELDAPAAVTESAPAQPVAKNTRKKRTSPVAKTRVSVKTKVIGKQRANKA